MKRAFLCSLLPFAALTANVLHAQEANSGFDLRATVSGLAAASNALAETPGSGMPVDAGFRSVFYPTWKLSDHWTVAGAVQVYSHPYFFSSFSADGHGVKGNLLQATLNYSRVSQKGAITIRAGQLSTAFGSFLLRYDDADNPLIDLPIEYGYYGSTVSSLGITGAQMDASRGKWDGRVQLVNSSPANPRSVFAHDQYANWAGGGGYTIRQGLRIGASAYRGPYLDRKYPFFFPGEARPVDLPAHALGVDVQWATGHWNIQGEYQRFVFPYRAIPTFREQAGYAEVKRVLHPRWYIAARNGYVKAFSNVENLEVTLGFRPNRQQLIKVSYEVEHSSQGVYRFEKTFAVQIVTTLHPLSIASN